ncbi:MAG: hypothetical protein AMXMBFR13_22350 [Phycisphaerae bacterium]
MIDLSTEQVISLAEAARRLPRRRAGKKAHVSCVYRWTTAGCKGVILESVQVGGTRCTSVEAIQRFIERLTTGGTAAPTVRTSQRREREIAAAEKRLQAVGI